MLKTPFTHLLFIFTNIRRLLALLAFSLYLAATPAIADQNVTFLTAEGGAGHIMIEKAFKDALAIDPSSKDLKIDSVFFNQFLTEKGKSFEARYTWWAEHAPKLWDAMVDLFPKLITRDMKRRFVRGSFLPALAEAIQKNHPDVIYCTHYTLAEIVDILKEDGLLDPKIKVVSQVTDYSIIAEHNTRGLVVVPHPALKDELARFGKDPAMIKAVSGIPARPAFLIPYDTKEERAKLAARLMSETGNGIDRLGKTDPFIVAAGGGDGRNLRFLADFLPKWHPDRAVKIAVICGGKNKALYERFAALANGGQLDPRITLIPRGFEAQMDQFMKSADLILSKPGGSTTAEVMALGKPLFVNTTTGIQEERNLKFLEQFGAAKTIQFSELNHMDQIMAEAKTIEEAAKREFPTAKNVPNELIAVFNDYRYGRIPDSPSEAAGLAQDIQRRIQRESGQGFLSNLTERGRCLVKSVIGRIGE